MKKTASKDALNRKESQEGLKHPSAQGPNVNPDIRKKAFTRWLNFLLRERIANIPAYPLKDNKFASYFTDQACVVLENCAEAISKRVMSKFAEKDPLEVKILHCMKHCGKEIFCGSPSAATENKNPPGTKVLKVHLVGAEPKNIVYQESTTFKSELEKFVAAGTNYIDYIATDMNGRYVDCHDPKLTIDGFRTLFPNTHEIRFTLNEFPPTQIAKGDIDTIFALLFRFCSAFQMRLPNRSFEQARTGLLDWCKSQGCKFSNFVEDIKGGEDACALVNKFSPDAIPAKKIGKKNWSLVLKAAEKNLKIPEILDADDFSSKKPDEMSIMVYFALLRTKDEKEVDILAQIKESKSAPLPAPVIQVLGMPSSAIVSSSGVTLEKAQGGKPQQHQNIKKFAPLATLKVTTKQPMAGAPVLMQTTPPQNHFQKEEEDFVLADVRVDVTPEGKDTFEGTCVGIGRNGNLELSFLPREAGNYKIHVYILNQSILSHVPVVKVDPYFDKAVYTFV